MLTRFRQADQLQNNMPYISKLLALSALALATLTTATPIDPSTHSLAKRDDWVFGRSKCPDDDGDIYHGSKNSWRIRCGYNINDKPMGGSNGNVNFQTCISGCGNTSGCVRVTFNGKVDANSAGSCYYFSSTKATPFKDATTDNKKVATKV
ncbi:hypothetical protein AC578_4876 [Pseudocercospora eumusae]|uniref:Apple domain-containing protein n=1 Tax=Pseudocercospora eumusae TaxID=321146 RepID=A0A139HC69_9PEZI|nr:hypothetical protein AC578_4876 [Pseudocercospora eumusae]